MTEESTSFVSEGIHQPQGQGGPNVGEIIMPGDKDVDPEPDPEPTISHTPEGDPPVDDGGTDPEPKEAAYEPNYSYKVYDKEEQFPEYVHPLITDQEKEQQFRELYGKAGAFDDLKERERTAREEASKHREELTGYRERMQDYLEAKKTDLGLFLEKSGVKDEELYEYVDRKLRMREMDPQQRAQFEEADRVRRQNYDLQRQNQQSEQSNRVIMERMHSLELDQALSNPDTAQFAQHYDALRGQGSFRNEVMRFGQTQDRLGNYVRPSEAVQEVVKRDSWMQAYQPQQVQPQPGVTPTPQAAPQTPRPSTIPNMGAGRGVSPAAKKVGTINDLRTKYQQKFGS